MGRSHIDPRDHTELHRTPWGHDKIYTGTLTGTNQTLPLTASHYLVAEVLVQADLDNGGEVIIGNVTERTIRLEAGDSIVIPINDLRKVYVDYPVGGATVRWLAVGA